MSMFESSNEEAFYEWSFLMDLMGSMPVFFLGSGGRSIILFFGMFFLMLSRFYIWMFPKHRGGGCLPPKMDVFVVVFFGKPFFRNWG